MHGRTHLSHKSGNGIAERFSSTSLDGRFHRLGDEFRRLMHLVPAPAVRLSWKDKCYPDQASQFTNFFLSRHRLCPLPHRSQKEERKGKENERWVQSCDRQGKGRKRKTRDTRKEDRQCRDMKKKKTINALMKESIKYIFYQQTMVWQGNRIQA